MLWVTMRSRLFVHSELARVFLDGDGLVVAQIIGTHDEVLGGVVAAGHMVLVVSPIQIHPDHVLPTRLHGRQVRFVLRVAHLHLQPKRSLVVDLGCGRHRHVGDDLDTERGAIVMPGVILRTRLQESSHVRN
jgi:hypothetical protein